MKKLIVNITRSWWGLIVLPLILLLNGIFALWPGAAIGYFKSIFQLFRVTYDHTLGFLPVGLITFILLGLLYWIFMGIRMKGGNRKVRRIRNAFNGLVAIYALFYILWGFNYHRPGLASSFGTTAMSEGIDSTYLINEITKVSQELGELRTSISLDTLPIRELNISDMESELRKSQEIIFKDWDVPTVGRVRVRKTWMKGALLHISTAGIYIPHSLEGHIDGGLHPLEWPFTMAHEMAHGYGVTDEGECNFLGLITCLDSKDRIVNYSGLILYWRYLNNNYRKLKPANYQEVRGLLPDLVEIDLQDIYKNSERYPDLMPKLRNLIYDQYLKSHGVKEGMVSYSMIVKMMYQWKDSDKNRAVYDKWF